MIDLSWISDLPESMQRGIFEGPALFPPPGVTPNFVNPSNRNHLSRGVLITTAVFSGLLVFLRLFSRIFYHRKVALEDYAAVVALGAFAAYFYYTWQILIHHGLFVHQWNIQLKDMKHLLYNLISASIVYSFVIMPIKVGILLEWSKTFVPRGVRNRFWWICHFTLGVNVLFYVIITFLVIFGCTPREKMWNLTEPGKCLDAPRINIGSAIINCLSDIVILLLPQKIIWGLQLSFSKKLGVATVFAMGIFASICAAWRIHSSVKFATNSDFVYDLGEMCLVASVEMTLGFFVLCLPSFPKLVTDSPCFGTINIKSHSSRWSHRRSNKTEHNSNGTSTHINIQAPSKSSERLFFGDYNKSDTIPLTEPRISSNSSHVTR